MNYSKLKKIIESTGIRKAVFGCSTARLCSIGTGGKVSALVTADTSGSIVSLMTLLKEEGIGFVMLGGGTNILFKRDLPDLVLIKPGKPLGQIIIDDDGNIEAGASAYMPVLVKKAASSGLDLTFLAGIPGTVGGAVSGNSGSADKWICDGILKLKYIRLDSSGFKMEECSGDDIMAGYRSLELPELAAVISIVLAPDKGDRSKLDLMIRKNISARSQTQPLGARTSGCFFKNPEGGKRSAGALIDNCGLKGFSYGGARVSTVHANFIENFGSASPEDIVVLSRIIIDKVREKYGVTLEYEVNLIG